MDFWMKQHGVGNKVMWDFYELVRILIVWDFYELVGILICQA